MAERSRCGYHVVYTYHEIRYSKETYQLGRELTDLSEEDVCDDHHEGPQHAQRG